MAGFERQRLADRLAALLAPAGDPGDLNGALRCIVDAAATLFAPDLCAVLAMNPVTRKPMPPLRHTGALYSGAPLIDTPPRADGITRRVLEAGVVFVEHIADHPEYQSAFVQVEQIRAFAALTLTGRVRNEPLAVLYLDYRAPRRFDEVFREHVQQFATAAAALLQQTWLLHRYAEVARIGKEINHELSTVEELFQQLYTYMSQILDVSHGLLLAVYQNERNTLDLHLFEEGAYLYRRDDPLDGYCEYVLREERTLLVRRLSVERNDLPAQPEVIGGTELREEALIFVPLLIRDRALGVLSIQSPRPAAYDDEDARLLELLGNHVALALGNIRLFERLTHVNDVGRLLTDRFDADHTLEQLTRRIAAGLRADLVTLYLYDGTTFARPIRSGHMLEPDYPDTIVTRNDHAAFLALEQPSAVFAPESTHLYELLGGGSGKRTGFFERREQIRSTAAVPLKIGKDPLGVLFVNYRQPQRFDALQCQSIETMASYAAVALRSSQLFVDQRERQLRELQILRQIDQALAATLDLEPTLRIILELTLAHVEASKGSIFLYDPDHNVLETCAFHKMPSFRRGSPARLRLGGSALL
jgi:GAF domain-containing protein